MNTATVVFVDKDGRFFRQEMLTEASSMSEMPREIEVRQDAFASDVYTKVPLPHCSDFFLYQQQAVHDRRPEEQRVYEAIEAVELLLAGYPRLLGMWQAFILWTNQRETEEELPSNEEEEEQEGEDIYG